MAITPRSVEIGIGVNLDELRKGLIKAGIDLDKFAKGANRKQRGLGKALGKAGDFLVRSFDPLGRGWDLLGSQIDEVVSFEKSIARMAIAQGKSNEQMSGFREAVTRVSTETGIARDQVMAGAAAYQALTGDTEGASVAMSTFARVAQATGSSASDVATAAAALNDNMKIDSKDFEKVFSILGSQGKAGAVELKDFASEIAELSSQFNSFAGGEGIEGAKELGAAFQIARKSAGSSSKAATNLASLMTAITKNAKRLKKEGGVEVFGKSGKLRSFSAIIKDIGNSSKLMSKGLLSTVLGSSEAKRAFDALNGNMADFHKLAANTDVKMIGRDLEQYLSSPAGRFEQSMNALKLTIANVFTPEAVQAFGSAISVLTSILQGLIDKLTWARKLAFGETWEEEQERKQKVNRDVAALGLKAAGKLRGSRSGYLTADQKEQAEFLLDQEDQARQKLIEERERYRDPTKAGGPGMSLEDVERYGQQNITADPYHAKAAGELVVRAGVAEVESAAAAGKILEGIRKGRGKRKRGAPVASEVSEVLAHGAKNPDLNPRVFGAAVAAAMAAEIKRLNLLVSVDGKAVAKATDNAQSKATKR